MPKKKSGKKAAEKFTRRIAKLEGYVGELDGLSGQATTWAYEAAIIKLAVGFEKFMLECLIAGINNDTSTLNLQSGIRFPKHLSDDVCEYLITGGGYFDFKGRSGLIATAKRYLPEAHWFVAEVKKPRWKASIEELLSLRNLAAHESPQSKKAAKAATGKQNLSSAGVHLKRAGHFFRLTRELTKLSETLRQSPPTSDRGWASNLQPTD
jgi:hypothetical protein